jgi:hypothetical protein
MYVHENEAQKLGLAGDSLVEHRRRHIGPLAEQLKKWCAAVAPTLLPSEPLMVAVRYYQRHHEALFRFIDDANVPIDNSATEREFQNVAKLRLNALFAGDEWEDRCEGREAVPMRVVRTEESLPAAPDVGEVPPEVAPAAVREVGVDAADGGGGA